MDKDRNKQMIDLMKLLSYTSNFILKPASNPDLIIS